MELRSKCIGDRTIIKKFIAKLFKKKRPVQIISRSEHCISRQNISPNALKVLYRLNKHHYEAYLVGGCVRDLLMHLAPKDFDIATNATPEQIKALFRNSRIIGRRFRLVHVEFGRETIEVTTFRANEQADNSLERTHSAAGMILRDNIYGKLEDDIDRRDLTINAFYYNIKDFSVLDYHQGLEDLKTKRIRLIGDPQRRFREDPVRILRAIRFANKLGFTIEAQAQQAMQTHKALLQNVASSRKFEELCKLFTLGSAHDNFIMLYETAVIDYLLPHVRESLQQELAHYEFILAALRNTDERVKSGKTVTVVFCLAAILWPLVLSEQAKLADLDLPIMQKLCDSINLVLEQQNRCIGIPRQLSTRMREIWELQIPLERMHPQRAVKVLEHPSFRAAFDFLTLRSKDQQYLSATVEWWAQLYALPQEDRHKRLRKRRVHRVHR